MKTKRVVGIRNSEDEYILVNLSDYYVSIGVDEQLDAIELGYTNE